MDGYTTSIPRNAQERKGKIRTFTGLYVDPLSMRSEDIRIEDIAHHLSNECRYSGACPTHYSVAQHSVLVSEQFTEVEMQLAGLLHDAEEAYLKDMPSPIKHHPQMSWYRQLGKDLNRIIFEKFGIDPLLEADTKVADDKAFTWEVRTWWGQEGLYPTSVRVIPWPQPVAEAIFLERFDYLMSKRELGIGATA